MVAVDIKLNPGSFVGTTLDYGRLELISLIGSGTYGEVYLAQDRISGELWAVKCLPKPEGFPSIPSLELSEIQLHSSLPRHQNVIFLQKLIETPDHLFIVMEYCPGGDLYENIVNNPSFNSPYSDKTVKSLFLQIIDAVYHCHQHGVFHRDLKPENILVDPSGENIKLVDFGLASSSRWSTDIGCGSSYYMSPECQGGLDGSVKCYSAEPNDVWSLGVILINLVCGRNPWSRAQIDDPSFAAFLENNNFLRSVLPISDDFNHIIKRIFDLDPSRRISLPALRKEIEKCRFFLRPPRPTSSSSTLSSTSTLVDTEDRIEEISQMKCTAGSSRSSAYSWASTGSSHSWVDASDMENGFFADEYTEENIVFPLIPGSIPQPDDTRKPQQPQNTTKPTRFGLTKFLQKTLILAS